ncbi:tetratricopeptide repeat protein [Chryseobacterium gambrini]|jgi:tetratricopeptide (TPR) repeat protein|uniref:Tetratricopeptide repeat protein n=2 Tax=Chryseobacterium TaxID=59732 RepID=A0AAJ1R7G4_9FLAO|nr:MULTISPECIES: tetratricopeptide repeat protein [Chryseobacterium]MCF2220306.1 tetratricopeptide repeat protein [Chryseobacterium sp. PS-8]MDN4012923.1 tetratricopeptide repeat protein [Chryseobacterium gambrini]MDN4030568.1 tetratricopeptide repeat protein [Chryseobacterium gambrini]QWA36542.1 tetratricopeptide repeat protein [Chryseobacterium sp. ZHDP1]
MKDIMNMNVKKLAFGAAVMFFTNFAVAQTVQDGINSIDSDKYAQAKTNFTNMIASAPTAENYFYLGNTYLKQGEPDYVAATENFNKGLAADSKSYLNKLGLATVKLGKGDKNAIAEIQKIVTDSKEKDAEVLFRAAEALTLFEKNNSPDLAIQYLNKAIERAEKKGVPAHYYYTLGDAYRLKRMPGDAMSAYDKALPLAKNKASVYTRIGTLWMAAQQWQQAKTSIDKAIATDPSYAPAYKALAAYDIRYQQNAKATQDLINYTKYADEDPYTQLEIAKLYFTNEDYANSKQVLDKIFDKINDPIKFKLRAYQLYADGKYAEAKQNMDNFVSQADKSRVQPADQGLQGLIAAGLAKTEKDTAKKAALTSEAQQKIAIAKAAKDETLKWDMELVKIAGGGASQADIDAGPTNPTIEGLKQKVAANAQDSDSLFKLATAYQDAKNWNGAIATWQKMNALLPDWAPGYYSLGYSYQQAGNSDAAKMAYEKFISTVKPTEQDANKQTLAYAYFAVAYMSKDSDLAKAKDYVAKSVQLDPTYQDAVKLNAEINK